MQNIKTIFFCQLPNGLNCFQANVWVQPVQQLHLQILWSEIIPMSCQTSRQTEMKKWMQLLNKNTISNRVLITRKTTQHFQRIKLGLITAAQAACQQRSKMSSWLTVGETGWFISTTHISEHDTGLTCGTGVCDHSGLLWMFPPTCQHHPSIWITHECWMFWYIFRISSLKVDAVDKCNWPTATEDLLSINRLMSKQTQTSNFRQTLKSGTFHQVFVKWPSFHPSIMSVVHDLSGPQRTLLRGSLERTTPHSNPKKSLR